MKDAIVKGWKLHTLKAVSEIIRLNLSLQSPNMIKIYFWLDMYCNTRSISLNCVSVFYGCSNVLSALSPLCVFCDGRCWNIRVYCVSELYSAVHYVFVHKELVSLPFTINTESKQIVSIHWTGWRKGTRGSVTKHRWVWLESGQFYPTLRLFSILTPFTV